MLPLLKRNSDIALHEQLYRFYKKAIIAQKIKINYKLPPVRKLALNTNVSINTVTRAYQQLVDEGYILSKPKRGLFALEYDPSHSSVIIPGDGKKFYAGINSRTKKISLLPSTINEENFPLKEWRKVQQMSLDDLRVQYDFDQDSSGLSEQLIKYLYYSRGVTAKKEQVFITAGTNQSLSFLCLLLKDRYNSIIFEEPGYERARNTFMEYGYKIEPILMSPAGMSIRHIKKASSKLMYVTPSHHYPTGVVMTVKKRLELIAIAKRKKGFIIEDDYETEFRYKGKPIPALQAIDSAGCVIYMGTFSKIFLPSLRVAYLVLPEQLLSSVFPFRYFSYSVAYQVRKALALFIEKGYWEKHLRKMQIIYTAKYKLLIYEFRKAFKNKAAIVSMQAGLSILVEIYTDLTEENIVEAAKEYNILIKGAAVTYYQKRNKRGYPMIFIGFGNMKNVEIAVILNNLKSICFKEFKS